VNFAIETLGARYGNAYILSSNELMPDVPMTNIVALFEACHSQ